MIEANPKPWRWKAPTMPALLATGVIGTCLALAVVAFLPSSKIPILLPILATLLVFTGFSIILKSRVKDNLLGEIGFIYVALAAAYTIFPAITFLLADLDLASGWLWETLSLLLPSPADLGVHLWRHVLFILAVSTGYLLTRGSRIPREMPDPENDRSGRATIFTMLAIIFGCMFAVYAMSAPVKVYWDHYTRFDHLGWFSLRFIYICLMLKTGGYFVVMALLFQRYKKLRPVILMLVPGLVVYETAYSLGQRIESLTILLAAGCLYHYSVKAITLKKGILSLMAIATLFTAIELFRVVGFSVSQAQNSVSQDGIRPANEFGAVFFTSYHLYAERAQGSLPPRSWQLFFNDFVTLVPFTDHIKWNPQYWYARYYFPDAVVPPQTLGPIAESGIWGGEIDLAIRGLINGALFAWIVRWMIKRRDKWWAMATYAYLYATCVMTLKYSVFYQLTPLIRILLPTLFVAIAINKAFKYGQRRTQSPQA